MKYKALICDVDGTLVPNNPGGKPSAKVRSRILSAKEKISIGIATARSYEQVYEIIENLKLSAPCIILGGAQVVDPISKKIFSEKLLDGSNIDEIYQIAEKMKIELKAADYGKEVKVTDKYKPYKPLDIYTEKLSFAKGDRFIQKVSHIPRISAYKVPGWGDYNKIHVMITRPEATKQHGILEIAEILGISTREIIGIGEGYNDFPFLMACGFKVAMGNAVKDVKAIADYIAPTVEEDGVADVIEKFILQ